MSDELRCSARIMREFKTRKADSCPPESMDGIPWPDNVKKYPEVCNGTVKVTVRVETEPDWGSTDYRLALDIECSRCKYPFVKGYGKLRHQVAMEQKLDVSRLLV